MIRRILPPVAAVLLASVAFAFAALGTASAQEGSEPGQPPSCAPGETCVEPEPCPIDTGCVDEPVPPPCPPDVLCIDPIPCPIEGPCGEEPTDTDGDGYYDFDEDFYGSDPDSAASTPEHAYLPETCLDGADNDGDGATDLADPGCTLDSDEDGLSDPTDNCPWDPNPGQADGDGDGVGDACDYDLDNDGWDDESERYFGSDPDNAASTPEHTFIEGTCSDGADNDADGATDAADRGCAPDRDFDATPDDEDNCPDAYNDDQADRDGDGRGDACEDEDGDGFVDQEEIWFGSDPDSAASSPETAAYYETCEDGIDNDLDGDLDLDDEFCQWLIAEDYAASGPPSVRSDVDDARDADKAAGASPVALPAAGTGGRPGDGGLAWLWIASAALAAMGALSLGTVALRRRVSER
ncbi:MAG: thrombospondin type 3 repeat-containing protein [Dehalococcoidia bacterium]